MIAYIYRPKRQRNGKLVFNRIWRARLKLNGDAKARDISLNCADKQTAEQKLRDSIRDYERRRLVCWHRQRSARRLKIQWNGSWTAMLPI